MKKLVTRRKFYNKWLYKITLFCRHGHQLRRFTIYDILAKTSDVDLLTLCNVLSTKSNKEYATRVEGHFIDIYTNSTDLIDTLISNYKNEIKHLFSPIEELLVNSGDSKTIISKKLPHDRYLFKVFLKPHMLNDITDKINYLKWLDGQSPRILISEKVKDWFKKTCWNWDRRYMYVEDEKTLLMVRMKNPEVVGSVYRFSRVDK